MTVSYRLWEVGIGLTSIIAKSGKGAAQAQARITEMRWPIWLPSAISSTMAMA